MTPPDLDRLVARLETCHDEMGLCVDGDTLRGLLAEAREAARLREDHPEWLCDRCRVIHPPQPGRTVFQSCPDCGETMRPTSVAWRRVEALERERDTFKEAWQRVGAFANEQQARVQALTAALKGAKAWIERELMGVTYQPTQQLLAEIEAALCKTKRG